MKLKKKKFQIQTRVESPLFISSPILIKLKVPIYYHHKSRVSFRHCVYNYRVDTRIFQPGRRTTNYQSNTQSPNQPNQVLPLNLDASITQPQTASRSLTITLRVITSSSIDVYHDHSARGACHASISNSV